MCFLFAHKQDVEHNTVKIDFLMHFLLPESPPLLPISKISEPCSTAS